MYSLNQEEPKDLGFGAVVARESKQRLLNHDGSFNVKRIGLGFWSSLNIYHFFLTMSWGRFMGITITLYFGINVLFALVYLLCGPDALVKPTARPTTFFDAFFFSVQTFATIGYGHISPSGIIPNAIVTLESFTGLFGVALATSIMFARFSRPTAKILFSNQAVIAPYQGITAFEFRIINARNTQMINLEVKVICSLKTTTGSRTGRSFHELKLERNQVTFFPLSWTIVHPIEEDSPLYGLSEQDVLNEEAEFLILLSGIDETLVQTVHARSSYTAHELVWNARFVNMFNLPNKHQPFTADIRRLGEVERA